MKKSFLFLFLLLLTSMTEENDVLLFDRHVRHACQSNKRLEHAKAMQSRFHLQRDREREMCSTSHRARSSLIYTYILFKCLEMWVWASITFLYNHLQVEEKRQYGTNDNHTKNTERQRETLNEWIIKIWMRTVNQLEHVVFVKSIYHIKYVSILWWQSNKNQYKYP